MKTRDLRMMVLQCILVALPALTGCEEESAPPPASPSMKAGTVWNINGAYVIAADDGEVCEPVHLDPAFQVENMRVRVEFRVRSDLASSLGWGPVIEILNIATMTALVGTVAYVPLEGGFFGILADGGGQCEPIFLDAAFQIDGLRVRVEYIERPDLVSAHMWGMFIEAVTVEALLVFSGAVTYLSLEGGFFGIVADDNEHYDPINLDASFQIDGLRVCVEARKRPDLASYHMWGWLIEILSIRHE